MKVFGTYVLRSCAHLVIIAVLFCSCDNINSDERVPVKLLDYQCPSFDTIMPPLQVIITMLSMECDSHEILVGGFVVTIKNISMDSVFLNPLFRTGDIEYNSEVLLQVYVAGTDSLISYYGLLYQRDEAPLKSYKWVAPGDSIFDTISLGHWRYIPWGGLPYDTNLEMVVQYSPSCSDCPGQSFKGEFYSPRIPFFARR